MRKKTRPTFALAVLVVVATFGFAESASARALAFGPELEIGALGSAQTQWRTITATRDRNVALLGSTYPYVAPGGTFLFIGSNNVFGGVSLFYRRIPIALQTPEFTRDARDATFEDIAALIRFGFMDYYYKPKWSVRNTWDELPAHGYGDVRFQVIYTDLFGADPDEIPDFEPGISGALGLEFGGLFMPLKQGYLMLYGGFDYQFGISPQKRSDPGLDQEVLANVLYFRIGLGGGFITDPPE
ncbi:MAG: hypothetical protein H6683_07675 [Deltaproteobacteria bacterium]|nr:hypothetical protein [Deltaproteobacteria bacterium]